MTRFLKHVGKNHLGSKVVVVFRELPDDQNSCLVVESQSLSDMYHDNLMRVVESNAAQSTVDLYEVLGRSHFGDGQQMLNALHQRGLLKKYSIDQIIVEPMPNRTAPLREVNNQVRAGKGMPASVATPVQTAKPDTGVVLDTQPKTAAPVKTELSEDKKKSVAESKLLQARLLEEDAQKLRKEAYELDPSLKKGGRPTRKQQEQVEQGEVSADEAEQAE